MSAAHNRRVHDREEWEELPAGQEGMRLHRRVGLEVFSESAIDKWNREMDVSVSATLEAGNKRALFPFDITSYLAFDCSLKPSQSTRQNKIAIARPGRSRHLRIANRLRAWTEPSRPCVMMD